MSQLKAAVIGTGYFSHFHFDAWKRISEVDVVACCDTDLVKAQAAADQFEVPQAYDNYQTMLDEHDVDFVDIVTRPDTHLTIVKEIASRGIAMICQKPLAPDMKQVHELLKTVRDAGVRFMVHENFRFQPWYREVRRLLEAGEIGDRLHTLTFRNRAGDGWGDDAYLARQPYFQTMKKFLIFEAGIHTIDTFRYLGGEIRRTWCVHRKLNPVIAGEDTALGIFEFDRGGMAVYDANRFNESTAENPRYTFGELLVEGNGGSIRLYDDARLTVQRLGEDERDHPYSPGKHGFAGDCVFATQKHFVDGLLQDKPFETDGDSYLKSIAVQEAMYRSAETGCWEIPNV
ncbi:MAG: Gfo/Idh/MocA family oxidoreductase [Fuerstiella sp.]